MLLPSKDIVGYISSMPIYFDCHVILQQNEEYHHLQFLLGKNVHASDYDPVVETFFIDLIYYQDNEQGIHYQFE